MVARAWNAQATLGALLSRRMGTSCASSGVPQPQKTIVAAGFLLIKNNVSRL